MEKIAQTEREGLPRLHVYSSCGVHYTARSPDTLNNAARIADRSRAPLYLLYDGRDGRMYAGTRIMSDSLSPETKRQERYAIFTGHDMKGTGVRDAIIAHFEAIGRFNDGPPGHLTLNSHARQYAKLERAFFSLGHSDIRGASVVDLTEGFSSGAPLGEFVCALREPMKQRDTVPEAVVDRVLGTPPEAAVNISIRSGDAPRMIDALGQIVQAHILRRPEESLEAIMPMYLPSYTSPLSQVYQKKVVIISPEWVLDKIGVARVDLRTGDLIVPEPLPETKEPERRFGFIDRILRRT